MYSRLRYITYKHSIHYWRNEMSQCTHSWQLTSFLTILQLTVYTNFENQTSVSSLCWGWSRESHGSILLTSCIKAATDKMCKQLGSSKNTRISATAKTVRQRSLRRSKSFKVIDFVTNPKPVLLVNNTNLHPISHRYSDIALYWSNYCLRQAIRVASGCTRSR